MQRVKDYFGVLAVCAVIGCVIFVGWQLGRTDNQPVSTTEAVNNSITLPTINQEIRSTKVAELYNKCETNSTSTIEPWTQSTPSVIYRDLNNDKIEEAFVYAKIPGSQSYTRGCVLSINQSKTLVILWRLEDVSLLYYSDFSSVENDVFTYSGKLESNARQMTFVSYKWSSENNTLLVE